MSGPFRIRRRIPPAIAHLAVLAVLLALTGTLAAALQVHDVQVSGAHRFSPRDVVEVLRATLGTPTVAARPETLRAAVRAVRWVADARVRVSLDGVVSCTVTERVPVAVGEDAGVRTLLDRDGNVLGPADGQPPPLTLRDFAPYPEERAELLAAVGSLEAAWGARLAVVERFAPGDVSLTFDGAPCSVVTEPTRAAAVGDARRVLAAWNATFAAPPRRLDARIPGRIVVLPAPPPAPDEGT